MGIKWKVLTWGLRIYCLLIDFGVFLRETGRSGPLYYMIFVLFLLPNWHWSDCQATKFFVSSFFYLLIVFLQFRFVTPFKSCFHIFSPFHHSIFHSDFLFLSQLVFKQTLILSAKLAFAISSDWLTINFGLDALVQEIGVPDCQPTRNQLFTPPIPIGNGICMWTIYQTLKNVFF